MGTTFAIYFTATILGIDIIVLFLAYFLKVFRRSRAKRMQAHRIHLEQQLSLGEIDEDTIEVEELFQLFKELHNAVALPQEREEYLLQILLNSHLPHTYTKQLRSRRRLRRIEAAANLRYLHHETVKNALLEALKVEHDATVAIYIGQALSVQNDTRAIIPLISHIRRASPWMAGRLRAILFTYEEKVLPYLLTRLKNTRSYMQRIICEYAFAHPDESLRSYLVLQAQSQRPHIRKSALRALLKNFPEELVVEPFTSSQKRDVLRFVIYAYAAMQDKRHISTILSYSRRKSLHDDIVQSLAELTYQDPAILSDIVIRFNRTKSAVHTSLLAKVLDRRIEYFLMQIAGPLHDQIASLIDHLVRAKQTSGIIFFLNRNRDATIEKQIIQVLRPLLKNNPSLKAEIVQYLDKRLVKEFQIRFSKKKKDLPPPHKEPPQRLRLALTLILVMLLFPIVILASEFTTLVSLSWGEIGRLYIVRFNYLMAFYSIMVNCIYLTILLISVRGSRIQARLWDCKDPLFLYTSKLLPAVSIIAPAFNEANNIVESVNSLLNVSVNSTPI